MTSDEIFQRVERLFQIKKSKYKSLDEEMEKILYDEALSEVVGADIINNKRRLKSIINVSE